MLWEALCLATSHTYQLFSSLHATETPVIPTELAKLYQGQNWSCGVKIMAGKRKERKGTFRIRS
jgi:hypothetical protein